MIHEFMMSQVENYRNHENFTSLKKETTKMSQHKPREKKVISEFCQKLFTRHCLQNIKYSFNDNIRDTETQTSVYFCVD